MRVQEAYRIYGVEMVEMIQELVSVSDADGVWAMMGDMGNIDAQLCVEDLYFNEEDDFDADFWDGDDDEY